MIIRDSHLFTKAGIVVIIAGTLAATPLIRFAIFAFLPTELHSSITTTIEVQKGLSPNDLTKTLVAKNLVSSSRDFLWLGRLTRQWGRIKAGEYELSPSMSPFAILLTFTSGISIVHPVTVREGENIYEIAQDLREKNLISSARTFLALCNNQEFIASLEHFKNDPPHSLEGYLLPDTYFLDRTLSEQDIAKKMVHHFFEFWGPDQEKQSQEKGIPRNNLITLASMIEKETGAAEERPLISSVFYNRLRKKMKLQSDPTTIYGIWNRYHGSLHKADLREKNEYNTYQISGLPAGPIANPGKEAISAALKPAESNFLYFVSHNDGTHEFTSNYADHLAAVRKFQLNPKAREGKSWRDLARRQNNRSHSIAQ